MVVTYVNYPVCWHFLTLIQLMLCLCSSVGDTTNGKQWAVLLHGELAGAAYSRGLSREQQTWKGDGGLALIEPEEEGNVQAISRNPLALTFFFLSPHLLQKSRKPISAASDWLCESVCSRATPWVKHTCTHTHTQPEHPCCSTWAQSFTCVWLLEKGRGQNNRREEKRMGWKDVKNVKSGRGSRQIEVCSCANLSHDASSHWTCSSRLTLTISPSQVKWTRGLLQGFQSWHQGTDLEYKEKNPDNRNAAGLNLHNSIFSLDSYSKLISATVACSGLFVVF